MNRNSEKTNRTIEYFRSLIDQSNVQSPSPVGTWLRPILKEISYGKLVAEVEVRQEMINTHKTLHGGMTSLIFDEVIGATVYCLEKEFSFVTVTLNVNFLSPASLGDKVLVSTQVIRNGQSIIHVEAQMTLGEKLLATAHSVLVTTGKIKQKDSSPNNP